MDFPTITEFFNLGPHNDDKRTLEFKIVFTLSARTIEVQVKYNLSTPYNQYDEFLPTKWFESIVEAKLEAVYDNCKNGCFDVAFASLLFLWQIAREAASAI